MSPKAAPRGKKKSRSGTAKPRPRVARAAKAGAPATAPITTALVAPAPLAPAALRWRCQPESLAFQDTTQVDPIPGVIGQETAIDALRFGLETRAPGQHVFVRGLAGTGRLTLIRRQLEELGPTCPLARDRCYVNNFAEPDRPRLINLPRGRARAFDRAVDELADFIRDDLGQALGTEHIRERKAAIDQTAHEQARSVVEPFEKALEEAGLALVTLPVGPVAHSVIFPLVDGKPVTPEEFETLHEQGKVLDEQYENWRTQRATFEKALTEVNHKIHEIGRTHAETLGPFLATEARSILRAPVERIETEFPDEAIRQFLAEVVDDVAERRLQKLAENEDFTRRYRVNVILAHTSGDGCPIIIENAPTLSNLLGAVDREVGPTGSFQSDHLMIRAGSLLRSDGGYLIMEAREVLSEPGAWKVLVRTLRSGLLEIVPPEMSLPFWTPGVKPQAIDVDLKVILIGDGNIYYMLDAMDPDFPHLFKVLADFDSVIPRDEQGVARYAGVLARIAREEKMMPLDRTAVAALVEHGARIAARAGKLTARFGRVADLAREGAYIAAKRNNGHVTGEDIREAIRRTKRRADLPSRRFREFLADGTIKMATRGSVVGQINGLAVLHAGPLTYGFPARITATIGPGSAGVINIEREAALSGAIHTKGFYILGGLLRYLLRADHPLAFDASIAFEQSYGGIDGDSASGAEICCLLSALTGVAIRQDIAMTGAIDQVGHVLAIGAVNEKIEGFFDVCRDLELTGTQGVIIPAANAGDLMLRDDVVEACAAGRFRVWPVETIHEALELLTGTPAGRRGDRGDYPRGSLLARAVTRARQYWVRAASPTSAALMRGGRHAERPQPDEDLEE